MRWMNLLAMCAILSIHAVSGLGQQPGQSPVDHSQAAELIRSDFGLVDGAAANGNVLYVPDVKAQQLLVYRPSNSDSPWQTLIEKQGSFSGTCFQLGELYIADGPGGRILKSAGGKEFIEWVRLPSPLRPNDLVVDAIGNAYATITKEGQVLRVGTDGSVATFLEDLETPNGIALSPDGSTLYVSLYKSGRVVQAKIDGNLAGEVRELAKIDASEKGALADGMTVDRAGNIYCTGAEAIWIWNPNGDLLDKLVTPERPINCTFGGPQGQDLFISTFGGLLRQPMLAYGVQPNPAMSGELASPKGKPSTVVSDSMTATINQVFYQEGTRKLLCDIFAPNADEAGQPAIILVHGGGWLHGDKTKFRPLALKLASRGYVVMAIEYRLGFESLFPAGIRDCNAATLFLRSNAAQYNIDPDRIAAVGGSAGGHLVGLMATGSDVEALQPTGDVRYLTPTTRAHSSALKAAVVMAGPMQMASGSVADRSRNGMTSNATYWLGKTLDEAPDLYRLADAFEKISADDPPLLFLTGSLDNPTRDELSLQKLKSQGVAASQIIHEGATHGHWNRVEWMDQVVDDICEFLGKHL